MRSLRLRLIAFAAIAIAVALGAAWHVMGGLFGYLTEQRMAITLIHEGNALIAATTIGADGRPHVDMAGLDARTRRRASGLYWEMATPGGGASSPSLAGATLSTRPLDKISVVAGWRKSEIAGPYETDLVLVERSARIGNVAVSVRLGQDDEPIDRACATFGHDMGLFLLALGMVLSLGAWLQVELGLRPLRRVRRELAAMERNPAQRLSDDHPHEIEGLVRAINALADARSEDVARARRRAADLAHALKTPLAALGAQSRAARSSGARAAADAIDDILAAAAAALESELARARAAASHAGVGAGVTCPATLIEGLFAVLERTERGLDLVFDLDAPADWRIAIDPDSFAEILGNLLDNAARHARRMVRVRGTLRDDRIVFTVDDDGPGIAADERSQALRRGVRLDESGSGHGLGLAIVADLVEATGGAVTLEDAPQRGLRVVLGWPAALLCPEPPKSPVDPSR
jgi:signal transduction histidine kinase